MREPASPRAGSPARSLKRALKQPLSSAWAWPLLARFLPPACLVLAYHRVAPRGAAFPGLDPTTFRAQMEWIRRECTPIAPDRLRDAASQAPRGRIPVLVTFDDGYLDYAEYAYPVLKALDIPAVNFLPTRFIDEGGIFWWDAILEAGRRTRLSEVRLPWSGEVLRLDAPGRARLVRQAKDHLKLLMEDEKVGRLQEIVTLLGVDLSDVASRRHVMTWDQVRATSDVTTYGGHLHTHPLASRIDAARLDEEIRTCRDRIAAELGRAPEYFAYPDGDITEAAKPLLRGHGFHTAFGITEGFVRGGVDWMAVPRFPGPQSVGELAWRVAGLVRPARPSGR